MTSLCQHPPSFTSVPGAATVDSSLRALELLWDVRRRAGGALRLMVPNQNPLLPGTPSRLPGRSAGVPIWANAGVCSSSSHLLPGLQAGGSASRQQVLKIRLAGRQHSMTQQHICCQACSVAQQHATSHWVMPCGPHCQGYRQPWPDGSIQRQRTDWQAASMSLIGGLGGIGSPNERFLLRSMKHNHL